MALPKELSRSEKKRVLGLRDHLYEVLEFDSTPQGHQYWVGVVDALNLCVEFSLQKEPDPEDTVTDAYVQVAHAYNQAQLTTGAFWGTGLAQLQQQINNAQQATMSWDTAPAAFTIGTNDWSLDP